MHFKCDPEEEEYFVTDAATGKKIPITKAALAELTDNEGDD